MAAPLGSTLHIAIVGAGMGGLATALALAQRGFTHISVYEAASDLGFLGAGIQVAPNLSRQLQDLGVWEYLKEDAVEMMEVSVRASDTDQELSNLKLKYVAEAYGQPHRVAHRSALANALYKGCRTFSAHITFHFRTTVLDVDFENHCIRVKGRDEAGEGQWISADVILGADGVKSVVRKCLLARHGEVDQAEDTGQAAYRIMLHRDQMAHDPELLAFVNSKRSLRWIGSQRQIIAYPISGNTIFNIATTQPDVNFASEPTSSWTTRADKGAMLEIFSDFCPIVLRLLDLAPAGELCEWKLRVRRPLKTWVEGNITLVGDACHPALPHLGQGAAQAIEDGAVLAAVMSKLTDKSDVNAGLLVYERLRKVRTEYLVEQAAASGKALLLTDADAKAARDAAFLRAKSGGPNPDKWLDKQIQDYIYGFDCIADVDEHYTEYFAAVGVRK
ncbi:2-polyprenyl-6-methoxyphenol hydroxylase [Mycena rebaudengoi]|nr:2-polyprenyl-6-methoxyphenol hydroxylase [Mycena rebaudengoi]